MQKFVYEYATKVYFGAGAVKEHLAQAVSGYGQNVMLAYGGGSVKKNGIYDEVKKSWRKQVRRLQIFQELCQILPMPRYRKAPAWQRKRT